MTQTSEPFVAAPAAQQDGASPRFERPLPVLRVRHLWHRFGDVDVLKDVSFEVGEGEIFGFIGPNGAGKTTTLRIIATLLEPMAGRVEVAGHDVVLEPEAARRIIGYMPDYSGVYQRLSVREYLGFFARATGNPDPTVVSTVLELVELTPVAERLVSALSKGMRQRLQLARILLHDPKLLVLDEPASDLDPRARIELRTLLFELRDLGKTIILSSHILAELSDICSSVGIIEHGELLLYGPVSELARRLESRTRAPSAPEEATGQASDGNTVLSEASSASSAPATARRLRLRVLGDAQAVMPLLVGGRGILGLEPSPGGHLVVHYSGGDVFVAEVVAYLVSRGVGIVAVEPERNRLEQIFLDATRGGLR